MTMTMTMMKKKKKKMMMKNIMMKNTGNKLVKLHNVHRHDSSKNILSDELVDARPSSGA